MCSTEIQHVIDALADTHVNGGALIKCFTVNNKGVFKFPIMMENYNRTSKGYSHHPIYDNR